MSGFHEFIDFLDGIPSRSQQSLKEIGLYMQGKTTRRLQRGQAKGPPLAASTVEQKGNDIKLVDTGRLMGSIEWEVGRDYVKIGTEVFYAEFHQSGTKNIPQRKFIYHDVMDERIILKILEKAIMNK